MEIEQGNRSTETGHDSGRMPRSSRIRVTVNAGRGQGDGQVCELLRSARVVPYCPEKRRPPCILHKLKERRGGIRSVSRIVRSASYRFNVADVPKIATVARAHCPKRPWTSLTAPSRSPGKIRGDQRYQTSFDKVEGNGSSSISHLHIVAPFQSHNQASGSVLGEL